MIDPALDAASDQIRSAETVIPMVQAFFDEATFAASYMVWDAGTKRGNHRQRTGLRSRLRAHGHSRGGSDRRICYG
jgi:hypothetical protein